MMIKNKMVFFVICFFYCLSIGMADQNDFTQREDVQQFMNDVSARNDLKKEDLEKLLSQVKLNEVALGKKQASDVRPTPWYQFRVIFIQPERIQMGVKYWKDHKKVLDRVAKKYGVPQSVIVSIIGVETKYGDYQGDFRALDSLATLAFNYPPRQAFFKFELEQFFLMCKKYHLDPLSIYGSYTGAIGKLQFMPHAVMDYVVQYDASKPLDLSHNDADIIASIANYLKQHGWQQDGIIAMKAEEGKEFDPKALPNFSGKPSMTIEDLKKYYLYAGKKVDNKDLVFVAPVEEENGMTYFIGFQNLSVLMTYNQNVRYGLVVDELSQAIQQEYNKK